MQFFKFCIFLCSHQEPTSSEGFPIKTVRGLLPSYGPTIPLLPSHQSTLLLLYSQFEIFFAALKQMPFASQVLNQPHPHRTHLPLVLVLSRNIIRNHIFLILRFLLINYKINDFFHFFIR